MHIAVMEYQQKVVTKLLASNQTSKNLTCRRQVNKRSKMRHCEATHVVFQLHMGHVSCWFLATAVSLRVRDPLYICGQFVSSSKYDMCRLYDPLRRQVLKLNSMFLPQLCNKKKAMQASISNVSDRWMVIIHR